jgi:ribosomal protein S10
MKKLVLFIHGLGGAADKTWKKFPDLLREDAEITEQYDVAAIDYSSGPFGSKPGLPICAGILKSEIEHRYSAYSDSEIALIAHSQGGLVARFYIAERINSKEPLRAKRLLTFATPHQGSGFATLLQWVPFASQQTEDLDPNSEFMRELAVAWGQAKADRRVLTKYVVAAGDAIVGQVSAMGPWSPGYEVVSGDGHRAVVKPETAHHTSFLIAKKFLLEDSLQPGGVEADYTAPVLSRPYLPSNDRTRFIFSARVLEFKGRDAEKSILADFLGGAEQPFRWMVMHGLGGVGKSRLALELCLAVRDEWHAGFLPQEGWEPDWGRWQPLMPTLIVIDPAARDTARTGQLLRALAGRGPAEATARLAAPVRVLLLERTGEGEWLKKIMGEETKKAQLELARAPNLLLTTIDDPWPIFEFVLNEKSKPLPDKAETLAALAEIDSERRPLFAYFMADAIARGVDIRHFDAARLLEEVIEHGRDAYWKPAGADPKDERLLAVATMASGMPVAALDQITEKLLPSWDIDRHPSIFLAMTGQEPGENIPPLEPDIVGEHFVLACLGQNSLLDANRARLCNLAWRLKPLDMAQFMLRAHRDLPDHPVLPWVRKSPTSAGEQQLFWAFAAVDLMIDLAPRDPDAAGALLSEMRGVAVAADGYWEQLDVKWSKSALWELWARAAAVCIGGHPADLWGDSESEQSSLTGLIGNQAVSFENLLEARGNFLATRDPVATQVLLNDMHAVAKTHDEARLWQLWAKAAAVSIGGDLITLLKNSVLVRPTGIQTELSSKKVFFYENPLVTRDPIGARALVDDIHVLAAARDDTSLWKTWTYAVLALMDDLTSRDPVAAWTLLTEVLDTAAKRDEGAGLLPMWDAMLRNIVNGAVPTWLNNMREAATTRDAPHLWEQWAKAAFSRMLFLRSRDPVAARALLDDMRGVAVERKNDSLWEWWASAAFKLMDQIGSSDPDAAQTLLNEIRKVAVERGEAPLWKQWTIAAHNRVIDLRSRDLALARALLDDMHAVAQARDEAPLWELWAAAAVNLTVDLRSHDPEAARALVEDLRGLAGKRNEATLWELWAKTAFNVMNDLLSRDRGAAQTLLDEMRGVAAEHGVATLWEQWAMAAANFADGLLSGDPIAARALLDDMQQVAAMNSDAELWGQWGILAHKLVMELVPRDTDAARALLNEMRGVVVARDEAVLGQLWAGAAFKLMEHYLTCDLVAAHTLLDDMRCVAQARDEALLWELWALAATNLTITLLSNGFGAADPAAAQSLLNGMRAVAVQLDKPSLWEGWAAAAINVTSDLQSRDPDAARALLNDMRGVAADRNEAPLWEQWAKAAHNRVIDLGSGDPGAARILLDDVRSVAVARNEKPVWEWWAKAAINLVVHLGSQDPGTARTLLDEMHGVVEARDEPPLWELWAIASFALIVDLGLRDPAASRALVTDMLEAVEKHPGPVDGWQTKAVGLVLKAAFDLTKDIATRDPDSARVFCADVLGLPEWLLQKMQFGD